MRTSLAAATVPSRCCTGETRCPDPSRRAAASGTAVRRRAKRVRNASRGVPPRSRVGDEFRVGRTRRGDRCGSWRPGRHGGGGDGTVTHWTQVLSNVSLVEFVLLAALTTLQWVRHRIRGAGWVALSFAILGGLSLTLKIDPGLVTNQNVAKSLIALLLVVPYCLFRFAATFRTPSLPVRSLAVVVTVAIVAFTFSLQLPADPGVRRRRHTSSPTGSRSWSRSGSCSATSSSPCSWPAGASRRSPPRACTCWPSRSPAWRSRWWWPHSGCRARPSICSPRRSPWRWASCS